MTTVVPLGQDLSSSIFRSYTAQNRLADAVLFQSATAGLGLFYRGLRLISYAPLKAALINLSTGSEEAKTYLTIEGIKTLQAVRNVLAIPSKILGVIDDEVTLASDVPDVIHPLTTSDYLKTKYDVSFQYFASEQFSRKNFKVITPREIHEMPVYSDPALSAVMGCHFLKSGLMGINFGCPNLALFTTHDSAGDEGSIYKVDAKSLKREDMAYKDTKGRLQSGFFLIPTNLPQGAIEAVEAAAKKLAGRRDYTCVNTNCRVLKEAGFSVEDMELEDCYLPTTCMENFLFRNVYYKGQKIHFDIVQTTPLSLEEYYDKIDAAVLTTPARHFARDHDAEENRKARDEQAKVILEAEKRALANPPEPSSTKSTSVHEVRVSVPSFWGDAAARVWGRHPIYELDLSANKNEISQNFSGQVLKPFPKEDPDCMVRLKRDFLFSQTAIRFLRSNMLERQNTATLNTSELLDLLKSTDGGRLNYTLFADRIVFGRVHLPTAKRAHEKMADWVLSKHALLADREEVLCAGEVWHDKASDQFFINDDSGTYTPSETTVEKMVALANKIFHTNRFVVRKKQTEAGG